ncbi:UBP-type zinc finger domain-containing protein [Fulvivirgaceae bacterium BMA12]|uniref:UBP-type zinc finger domain-containing protein n=1 Tax=Agaribacillus aureus TaxID=3051825 RepID=A0ABT8L033_9BACT|nr:UBP-type zinc finger domain-containing protein [Fulvivirgaceae bacterium BMA12]
MLKEKICDHLENLNIKLPTTYSCEECVKTGDTWVHLRTCQECGITLCCDSSPNKHASKHARAHGHPVTISAEPGETWAYCYEHRLMKMNVR